MVRTLIALAVVVLAGCVGARGRLVSEEEAEAYFRERRERYVEIVSLVEQCRPVRLGRSGAYRRVWADGSSDEGLGCLEVGHDVKDVVAALREADVVSVVYSTDDGPLSNSPSGVILQVSINVFSAGMVGAGQSVDFIYSPGLLPAAPADESGDGYAIERRLIGSSPSHWYWEYARG